MCVYVCMYVCGTGGRGGRGGGQNGIFGQLLANARIATLRVRKGIAHFPDNVCMYVYMYVCIYVWQQEVIPVVHSYFCREVI